MNELSLLCSGPFMLHFSKTERVLISRTRIVSEGNPEGGEIDFFKVKNIYIYFHKIRNLNH